MTKQQLIIPLILLSFSCQLDPTPASNGGSTSTGGPTAPVLKSPLSASVSVNDAIVLRSAIPPELFGVNIEWIEKGNGIANGSGVVSSPWISTAQSGGLDHVRWPGGMFSDYYNFHDGIGPLVSRTARSHHTDPATEADVLGTPGIAKFVNSVTGNYKNLLITVNGSQTSDTISTGSASLAADWVRYLNANDTASQNARVADGLPSSPIGVKYWEVGNELYLPDNPGLPNVDVSASVYASRFNTYNDAMKAVDPSIKTIAISYASSSWFILDASKDWLDTLLATSGSKLDLVSVHNAYFPVLYNNTEANKSYADVYRALWAAPEAVGDSLDAIATKLAATESSEGLSAGKIGISISEWGSLFGSDKRWIDHGKTLGSAIYIARMFQVFMARDRVRMAEAFKFSDSFSQGWVGFDGVIKPQWQVFGLFAKQKNHTLVDSLVSGSLTYSIPRTGAVEARSGVKELTSQVSVSSDNNTMIITMVNRSWDQPYNLTLDLPSAWQGKTTVLKVLSGTGVTDHNGPDVQSWVLQPYQNPPRTGPVNLSTTTISTSSTISLPPFSFAYVEITK